MIEIERKFLVASADFKNDAVSKKRIVQGFLNTHPERTVRVRIKGDKGFLTIKGKSNESGTTRFEWEEIIAKTDAEELLKLCEKSIVEKTRYEIHKGDHIVEVDEFHGLNEGLIIAEIELQHENDAFQHPNWLGREVTGEVKYYNSQLSKNPYRNWKNNE